MEINGLNRIYLFHSIDFSSFFGFTLKIVDSPIQFRGKSSIFCFNCFFISIFVFWGESEAFALAGWMGLF